MNVAIPFVLLFLSHAESLQTSAYTKTSVIENTCYYPSFQQILYLSSTSRCSLMCSKNPRCKRFMFCKASIGTPSTCSLYEDKHDCVVNIGSGSGCLCFAQNYVCNSGIYDCPIGKYGYQCQDAIRDCGDTSVIDLTSLQSKSAYIKPQNYPTPFEVTCDFQNKMTFFQQRQFKCSNINFNRSYTDYVNGFGNPDTEIWLGLEKISAILNNKTGMRLDIGIFFPSYEFKQIVYKDFSLGNAQTGYSFQATYFYSNGLTDALLDTININGRQFSTFDNDNTGFNCARTYGGGWWFADNSGCTNGNLNAPHDSDFGVSWNANYKIEGQLFMRIGH